MTIIKGTTGPEDFFRPGKSSIIKKGEAETGSLSQSIIPSSEEAVKKLEDRNKKIEGMFETTSLSPGEKSKIIEEALAEAECIKANARQESNEEIRKRMGAATLLAQSKAEEGFQKGFAEGKKEGFEAGKRDAADIFISALEAKKQMENFENEQFISFIPEAMEKVAKPALKKIVGDVIEKYPDEVLAHTLEEALALAKVRVDDEVAIRVNPEDVAKTKEKLPKLAVLVDIKNVRIIGDPSVDSGGCEIKTSLLTVDARMKTKIAALDNLFEQLSKEGETGYDKPTPA